VALRLDPLLLIDNFTTCYGDFFATLSEHIDMPRLHSITYGSFRFPPAPFRRMHPLYPEEILFSQVERSDSRVGYAAHDERAMLAWCEQQLHSLAADVPVYRQNG